MCLRAKSPEMGVFPGFGECFGDITNGFSIGAQHGLSTSLAASRYAVFANEAFTIIFK